MKKLLVLLAVVVLTVSTNGCSCCTRLRDLVYRGAACFPSAPPVAAPVYAAPPVTYAPPQPAPPVVQPAVPQAAAPRIIQQPPVVAAPASVPYCRPAPMVQPRYVPMNPGCELCYPCPPNCCEPSCGCPCGGTVVFDSGWYDDCCDSDCATCDTVVPYDGSTMSESPTVVDEDAVRPGPAE